MQGWSPDFIPAIANEAIDAARIDRLIAINGSDAMRQARELARQEGIFASPEGAATWAALRRLHTQGWIRSRDSVVLFNTGGWYKYAEGWRAALGL